MDWKAIYAAIKAHAENSHPFECCGLILNDGQVVESENVFEPKEYRNRRYTIDPILVNRYMRDDNIFGFYHSHPEEQTAYVSTSDNADASGYPGKRIVIAANRAGFVMDIRCFVAVKDARLGLVRLMPEQPQELSEVHAQTIANRVR